MRAHRMHWHVGQSDTQHTAANLPACDVLAYVTFHPFELQN